jgi:gephyrin
MGDRDLLKPLLERKGCVHFGRVLMKPGKPLTFATLELPGSSRKLLVFGLPGEMTVCFGLSNLHRLMHVYVTARQQPQAAGPWPAR